MIGPVILGQLYGLPFLMRGALLNVPSIRHVYASRDGVSDTVGYGSVFSRIALSRRIARWRSFCSLM
jgi:hypothetical protein